MQCFGYMPRVSVCRNYMAAKINRQQSFCVPSQYGSQKKPGKTLTAVHLIRLIYTVGKTIANQRGIYTLMLKKTCKLGTTVTFSCRNGKDVTNTQHNTNIIQKDLAWPKRLPQSLQISFRNDIKCVIMVQESNLKIYLKASKTLFKNRSLKTNVYVLKIRNYFTLLLLN